MKSSFDGSCAFDGSSCGNAEKPSMASLIIVGCALEDEIESPSSVFEERGGANTIVCLRGDVKEAPKSVGVPSASSFYVSEKKKGSKSVFLLWITDETVRLLEILD